MIILGKDKVDERYNIDNNGVITDLNGNIQETSLCNNRPMFRSQKIHKILMWTKFGWRDTKIWDIHHLDENKLNNSIDNLVFLTHSEHRKLHANNMSNETRKKLSACNKGKNNPMYGKHWKKDPITGKRIYY